MKGRMMNRERGSAFPRRVNLEATRSEADGALRRLRLTAAGRWVAMVARRVGASTLVPEGLVAAVVFLVLAVGLHMPTLIGLADNHDFNRLMLRVGIQYPPLSDDRLYFAHVNRFYPLGGPITTTGAYPSSTILVLALGVALSKLLS
jgi:hypothetical protein